MQNNKANFIWNQLQLGENQKTYGLGNQIMCVNRPLIGNVVEIPQENLQPNRSCDLNEFFRQYVCLFTNIPKSAVDQLENQSTYAIITRGNKEINVLINKGEVQQQEKPKKGQQNNPIDQFANLITLMKKEYKDQFANLGKILQFKHPPIINVDFVIESNDDAIQPFISSEIVGDEFEFVSYHLNDQDPGSIINSHVQQLIQALKSNKNQILYFNDRSIFPINKFDCNIRTFKSDFINNKRLLLYQKKLDSVVYEENNKIFNAHHYLSAKALENSQRYMVRGDYVFHHYMQDGFDDKGWGCAYRSFMTVLSYLMENGYTKKGEIPSHKRIQQILVEMGDKPVSFVGTSEWIGAFEVSMLINHLTGIESKILNVSKGTDVVSKLGEFKSYFENYGSPIMFGGGLYAYTLLGVEYNDEESRFLILDPHYTASDNVNKIIEKQGVSWKKADLFEEQHFYNFCMPLI